MRKKSVLILLSILMAMAIAALLVIQENERNQRKAELNAVNIAIDTLKNEKAELESQLESIRADSASPAVEQAQEGENTAILCFDAVTEKLYCDIYPALKEKGLTGIMILKDGQLPGDYGTLSVQAFLEMIHDGWSYGIAIRWTEGETQEEWKSQMDEYCSQLETRTGIFPDVYFLSEDGQPADLEQFLLEKGFQTVVFQGQSVGLKELKGIRLIPYGEETLQEQLNAMTGYCGLRVCVGWSEDTEEALRYSEQALTELVDGEIVKFTTMDKLMPIQGEASAEEEQFNTEEALERRLSEIEREINSLYR